MLYRANRRTGADAGAHSRKQAARFAALMCVLLLLVPALPAAAESVAVRVGMFPFAGFYGVNDAGERTGYGYELLQMMAQHANFEYTYVDNVPAWSDMERMLESGELDLLTCVQKTAANGERFAFSAEPIGTSYTLMTVRAGNDAVVAGDYSTYEGLRVGVIRDNSHAEKFAALAREKGFSYQPVVCDNLDALTAALQDGTVDAAVTSSLRLLRGEWIIEQFSPSPYYLMMRRGDSALKERVDQAIRQMDVSAPNWRSDLYNRYYTPDSGENLQLSAEERGYLAQQAGTVFRVAVCPDNAPYSFVENGEVKGIIPEVFAEIARRAGIQYEIAVSATHEDYRQLLRSGAVDLVMDSGWDFSTAEKMGYKLTGSYISLSLAQVSRIGDTKAVSTVAVPDSAILDELERLSFSEKYRVVLCPSIADTVKAVLSGDSDAAILFNADAQQYLASDVRSRLRVSLLPDAEVDLSVASSAHNDYLLLSVLSKSAESVRGSYVGGVVLKYTADMQEHIDLLDYLYLNPGWGVALAVIGALLLCALAIIVYQRIWYRRQKRLSERLQTAKQEADRANAAKSEFLSSISHDLRTPLNGILGFTALAVRESSPEKKQDYLLKIQSSGELLLGLVNDTLELSRIESGKLVLEAEEVSGPELIETVVTAVRPSAEQKDIRIIADRAGYPDEVIRADRGKIQKIVLNLLSNAVKYTPPGGTITLTVEIPAPPAAANLRRIVIRDTGIGMSPEFLQRLYEPFAQEHRPEAAGAGGTGLGLAIVKRMVDFLGGTITVESRVGAGTCFTVELPLLSGADAPAGGDKPCRTAVLAGRRVLLCEDNPVNTEIAVLLLRELGVTADSAADGARGAALFAASPAGTYDAVLMDLRMPELDGYGATAAIRALPREDARTVPIIAMTADAFEDDIRKCFAAGMNGHISKPVDLGALRRALETAIGAC